MSARYAFYFTPSPGSALARFGAAWLGQDAESGETFAQPHIDGFRRERIAELTATARQYSFHATLKAPFVMAEGRGAAALDRALEDFARCRAPIGGLGLKVGVLDGFIALLLTEDSTKVGNLAADCVRHFDAFRRELSEEELRRRRAAPLSRLEDALLQRWGYPYVMEAFRFHMTLTARLPTEEQDRILPALRRLFAPVAVTSFTIDAVSLCRQEAPERPFELIRRYQFAAVSDRSIATKEAIERVSGPSLTRVKTSSPST